MIIFTFRSSKPACLRLGGLLLALTSLCSLPSAHAVLAWTADVPFNLFEGQPMGFENEGFGAITLASKTNPAPAARNYDVLRSAGSTTEGTPLFEVGQDGQADISIKTQVFDGSDGRWGTISADKRRDLYRGRVVVSSGQSQSGDSAVVAYEFTFASGLQLTVGDVGVRLAGINGFGELYEWAFVTAGGISDAPFSLSGVNAYGASNYTLPGSTSDGSPLAYNQTISQYLTGGAGAPATGGAVQAGWWASDDFGPQILSTPDDPTDPLARRGLGPDAVTVGGAAMGLNESLSLSKFTVWMGYNDVAYNGEDGFTASNSTQESSISSLRFGPPAPLNIPEPISLVSFLFSPVLMGFRRKR